ncbi:MAG: SpoVR family protein [Armatimonadota bacterium]
MSSDLDALRNAVQEIWEASESTGLDPFPIHFDIVPASVMYEIGAYGLPGRFSHWTHGKAFHQMKTMYDYGLSKIYELIINTNPAQAFLMEANSLIQNKLVIAHVIGHSDFFKRNAYFQHTDRQMAETAGVTAERIRAYEREHGEKVVEEFLDAVLSIQEHIDPHLRMRRRDGSAPAEPPRRRTTPYDDLWRMREKEEDAPAAPRPRIPEEPEKDLLLFLLEYAPELQDWQRDVLNIVRNEMIYFLPQMQTKTMNEGWASYWHSRILREMDLTAEEHLEFTRLHAGVLSPSPRGTSINPYYVGFKIFEDIERRWNGDLTEEERREYRETNFGKEWPHAGKGREKMFEVREMENDVSFLRNYLTRKLVDELDMYIYRKEGNEWVVVEKDWRKIRDSLVESMTNFGFPYLVVQDGDYRRARELLLHHSFDGRELDPNYGFKTLRYLYQLWGRPVHLETTVDDQPVLWTYDGEQELVNQKPAQGEQAP